MIMSARAFAVGAASGYKRRTGIVTTFSTASSGRVLILKGWAEPVQSSRVALAGGQTAWTMLPRFPECLARRGAYGDVHCSVP